MRRKLSILIGGIVLSCMMSLLIYCQPDLEGWYVVDSALGTSLEDIEIVKSSFRDEKVTESDELVSWRQFECVLDKDGALSIYREKDFLAEDDIGVFFQHGYSVNKLLIEVMEYKQENSDERKLLVFLEWEKPIDVALDSVYLQYFSPEQYLYETQREALLCSIYNDEIIVKEMVCEYQGALEVCLDIEDYRKVGESKLFACIYDQFNGDMEKIRVSYRRKIRKIVTKASEISVEVLTCKYQQ